MGYVVRVESVAARTAGWQARVTVTGKQYVSRFFADQKAGGRRRAKAQALAALPELERRAARLRRQARAAARHALDP